MENDEGATDFKRFAAESLRKDFWRPKSRHNRFSDVGSRLFVVPRWCSSVLSCRVQQLAKKIGEELWNVGDAITKRVEIQEVKIWRKEKVELVHTRLFHSRANPMKKDSVTSLRM